MKKGQGYDFKPLLTQVKPYLQKADITFANQETMIGGAEMGLSSYPAFNSPYEVGDALKDAGVDIVSIANNHTLDRGEKAIYNAIGHWKEIDMPYVGAYENDHDRKQLRVLQTDAGISVAFLAYTYGTNGVPIPDDKEFLVNLIDKQVMGQDIAAAKKKADAVVLSLHFGTEYERMPNDMQKDLVQFTAKQGVDIVLGHHPHVLQPVAWVDGKDGHRTLAIYSLGNFLSGQDGIHKQTGGIFSCRITKKYKNGGSDVKIAKPAFIPTYVNYGEWIPTPLKGLREKDLPRDHYKKINKHMSRWVPELGKTF
ncbi:CapA family protein [Virgibacillus halophilus]|uniref:CapA family protein n=2 Tax=Tigheibacillus halophilus TaxID=361280 RepID=A0ABU5C924_9BACI|nr:CapA family protein [Virgibacillus halophilus]